MNEKNNPKNIAPTPQAVEVGAAVGGGFLRPSMLRSAVSPRVDDRPCAPNEPNGPCYDGKFETVNIPVSISGIPYIISVSVKSQDYRDLHARFGPEFSNWVGQGVQVYSDPVLQKLRVQPL